MLARGNRDLLLSFAGWPIEAPLGWGSMSSLKSSERARTVITSPAIVESLLGTCAHRTQRRNGAMHPSDPANVSGHSHSSEPADAAPTRRKLLGTMAAAGALLGMNATHASGATPSAEGVA